MLSSLRIQVNQTFSHFFFVRDSCAANNASIVQKVNKKKRRTWGSAPHPAAFEKAGETFLLLTVSVGAWWRVKFFFRNRLAALPEKDSLLQSFRQAFFKRPRSHRTPSPS